MNKPKQLYRVKIKPEFIETERAEMQSGNSVFQPSIIDGYLASFGEINEYSRGEAIKKAAMFHGKIEKAPAMAATKKQTKKKTIIRVAFGSDFVKVLDDTKSHDSFATTPIAEAEKIFPDEAGGAIEEFDFDTKRDADTFIRGLELASGWKKFYAIQLNK